MSAETRTDNNVTISDNTFNYCGGVGGIHFNKYDKGPAANDVLIENNIFDTGKSYSIKVDSAGTNITFSGNTYKAKLPQIDSSESEIKTDY